MEKVEYGYCHCGCGQKTTVSQSNDASHGYVKGVPRKFCLGHHYRGENSHMWRGGKTVDGQGYVRVYTPDHPRSDRDGYVFEHILVMEKSLGRYLVPPESVHHKNGIKTDNAPENLKLYASTKEHLAEHANIRAIEACGNQTWRKCHICKQYDAPENLGVYKGTIRHKECFNRIRREKRAVLRSSQEQAQ